MMRCQPRFNRGQALDPSLKKLNIPIPSMASDKETIDVFLFCLKPSLLLKHSLKSLIDRGVGQELKNGSE